MDYALMLRFRDLVTEPGGTIAEHRRIIRQRGHAWWGWWSRQHEAVPKAIFGQLLMPEGKPVEMILFDRGMMRLYRTTAGRVVVAPSHLGVNSPELEATPEYYVRGRYPAWFRLEDDILPISDITPKVIARPTECRMPGLLKGGLAGKEVPLDSLRDEPATLWIVARTGIAG